MHIARRMPTLPFRSQSGQTLIEIIIATGIVSLIMTALVALMTSSVINTAQAKAQSLATKYGQEGVELIRQERTLMGQSAFADAVIADGTPVNGVTHVIYCLPNPLPTTQLAFEALTSAACTTATNQYVDSRRLFQRYADIYVTDSGTTTAVKISIYVQWSESGKLKQSVQTQDFKEYNETYIPSFYSPQPTVAPPSPSPLPNCSASSYVNVALTGIASQISTYPGYADGPEKANDNNTNGNFYAGSVSLTNLATEPWWQINLGAPTYIDSVKLYNRTDGGGGRENGFWTLVSKNAFNAADLNGAKNANGVFSAQAPYVDQATYTVPVKVTGQYVRLQSPQTEYFNLAEVQITGCPVPKASPVPSPSPPACSPAQYVNLARGKPTYQSSTLTNGVTGSPDKAVDGNTDGDFFHGSVSHTNADNQAWWTVDLGSNAQIGYIMVYNHTDCCTDRLANFWAMVGPSNLGASNLATAQGLSTWRSQYTGSVTTVFQYKIDVNSQGRWVRIQLPGTQYLEMAEVQVMGCP
jgi:Tfp pilus assembly protein PilV